MINKTGQGQNNNQNQAITEAGDTTAIESGLQQLAAAAIAEGWMEKVRILKGERSVSANELTSLTALITYVAHKVGANEFRIERDLADRFNVANVKCLPACNYDKAIRYLVDLVPASTTV